MSDTASQKSNNNGWRDIMCGCLDRDDKPLPIGDIHASIPINVSSEPFDFAYCSAHDCVEIKSNSIDPMQDIAHSFTPVIDSKNIKDMNSMCSETMIISGFTKHSSQSAVRQKETCDLVIIMNATSTSKTRTDNEDDTVSNVSDEDIASNASEISLDMSNLTTLILDEYAQ